MKNTARHLLVALLWVTAATATAGPTVEYHAMAPEDGTKLPFSEAVRVGDLLFLSGQIGNIPGTLELAAGGIAGQTRQTLQNIEATLKKYGASMDDVVKCTVFMADISQWAEMNEVYVTFFKQHYPARSALGANGLALGALTEIECIAALPD